MTQEVHVDRPTPRLAPSRVRRASWGAIFGGMFVTIVLQIMFTLLGIAVGIATLQPSEQPTSGTQWLTASGIWLLVTGLVSIWIGSCIAGRLSGGPRRADGMLHGIVSWSVSMVAMFALLATSVGAILGGTASLVGNAMSSRNGEGGQGGTASLQEQVKGLFPHSGSLLPPTGRTEGQQTPGNLSALAQQDSELASALSRMESKGGAVKDTQDRDQVVSMLTTKHNLNHQDASNLMNQWDQQFQQARGEARQVGQSAAHGLEWGSFWGFIGLILGLLVAAWGGWAGTASLPRPTEAAVVRT